MNRIFLAVASMICTHFVVKVYDKLTQKPPTKEEIYRRMRAEYERRKGGELDTIQAHIMQNHLSAIRNQQDGNMLMNSIGTVSDLEPVMGSCI